MGGKKTKQWDPRERGKRDAGAFQRMCGGKTRFRDADSARAVARRYGQRIYPCSACRGWHCAKSRD